MTSEEKKDVSCFSVDGVVAEMVIDIDDGDKAAPEDAAETEIKLTKISGKDKSSKGKSVSEVPAEKNMSERDSDNDVEESKEKSSKASSVKSDESNQSSKNNKKRKLELQSDDGEEENNSDQPRYPGRKRVANKKFFSEELISGEKKRSDSVESNETSTVETSKEKKAKDTASISSEDSVKSKQDSSSKANTSKDVDSVEEGTKSKQDTLRKLPSRKNKDAPDVDDLNPKVQWYNGVGKGPGKRLGDIIAIRERIKSCKSTRPLFRVLYFQWPTNGTELLEQIFKFNGFPFEKTSYEFSKRQSMMKIMLDKTVFNIAEILGLKIKPKNEMIDDILHFLLSPYGETDPTKDESMQPVVLLEKIVLDRKFFEEAVKYNKAHQKKLLEIEASTPKLTRGTRGRKIKAYSPEPSSSRKTRNTSSSSEKSLSKASPAAKTKVSKTSPTAKEQKSKVSEKAKLPEKSSKKQETKDDERAEWSKIKIKQEARVSKKATEEKSDTSEGKEKDTAVESENELSPEISSSSASSSDSESEISEMKKKIKLLKKKLKEKKNLKKMKSKKTVVTNKQMNESSVNSSMDVDDVNEINEIPSEPVAKEKEKKKRPADKAASDSSETESSDEAKLGTSHKTAESNDCKCVICDPDLGNNAAATVPRRNVRIRMPLKSFPDICASIESASFSALQRLHILLFGSSDKAENLKSNILSFGGFPFVEGSEDWKQKHFLLSLLAQNNLKEYLTLLCLECKDDEDQSAMISKLMKFLAAPMDPSEASKSSGLETEVVSSVLTSRPLKTKCRKLKVKLPPPPPPKKKKEKKPTSNKSNRHRKVLMSEEEARRLEAKFAREQRALARERELAYPKHKFEPVKVLYNPVPRPLPPAQRTLKEQDVTPKVLNAVVPVNSTQLNALLQTVYKRRALKAAGAVISTPNKGDKIKLGDIENVKFLIVTSNLRDLELLHRLIFLCDASKSKVRKNILDFCGFTFNEDSFQYTERINFLNELGHDVSKRLSFLLGLCPLQTNLNQQDLNELIMYFLMAPCKSKQTVPITQMPSDSGFIVTVDKNPLLIKPANEPQVQAFQSPAVQITPGLKYALLPSVNTGISLLPTVGTAASPSLSNITLPTQEVSFQTSTPLPNEAKPKAKKSIGGTSQVSPVKKVLLPPSTPNLPPGLQFTSAIAGQKLAFSNKPLTGESNIVLKELNTQLVNNVMQSVDKKAADILAKTLHNSKTTSNPIAKLPKSPSTNLQLINADSNVAVLELPEKSKILDGTPVPSQLSKVVLPLQNILTPPQIGGKPAPPITSPQEYLVQQQTPDGKMKTFKLIRVPANHPLANAVKPGTTIPATTIAAPTFTTTQPPLSFSSPSAAAANLPPGIIIMKNNVTQGEKIITIPQSTPNLSNEPIQKASILAQPGPSTKVDNEPSGSANSSMDEDKLEPSDDPNPSDSKLYSAIQDIILNADFEDITLRNVIERVAAHFPKSSLNHRHGFMKECIKKIIIGTTE